MRIARAMLIALVPLTICVQAVLAHAPPISQTFRNGVTLTSFSGIFEVIWPLQVTSTDAVMELRDLALPDPAAAPLLQVTGGDAVESPYPCPTVGAAPTCSRMHLSGISALPPGTYAMYWRVIHLDDYVEQRVVRFTIDPLWVAPTPTPSVSPSPSTTPAPTATPRPSISTAPTPLPSTTSSPGSDASGSPEASPLQSPSPSPTVDGEVPKGISQLPPVIGAGALLLAIALAARGIAQWARGEKAKP
jgi:methionine-rich copper-binding protein CopC